MLVEKTGFDGGKCMREDEGKKSQSRPAPASQPAQAGKGAVAPGKRTRTMRLPPQPAGAGATLPHLDRIQRSFGRHDVSGVEVHTGGPAARASQGMGAEAYATGNHVAFGRAPDLHTAAHEAAHVVQQRAGVQLESNNVGQAGDAYERHADAIADAVVAGRSAEALLDQSPAGGTAGAAVQRKDAAPGAASPAGAEEARLTYSAAQIQSMIRQSGIRAEEIEGMALDAGMTAEEVGALRAGAPLAMTPAQEASLRASLAAAYARPSGEGEVTRDGDSGSTCGCSGNPSSTAPPQTVPAVTGEHTQATEDAPGSTAHTGSVGGGTVTLRHDVHYRKNDGADRPNGFAIGYEGPDAQNAHWLQFIWREIVQKDGSNNVTSVTGSITTTGGSYDLTAGGTMTAPGTPGESNYNTDSASSTDPFYESSGVSNRTADASTIYDHPSSAVPYVRRAFANGATEVKSRAHFTTFLVQTDRVTYRTTTNMEWHFTAATDSPAPVHSTGGNGAASTLSPDALRQRFHAQYPAFNFIQ